MFCHLILVIPKLWNTWLNIKLNWMLIIYPTSHSLAATFLLAISLLHIWDNEHGLVIQANAMCTTGQGCYVIAITVDLLVSQEINGRYINVRHEIGSYTLLFDPSDRTLHKLPITTPALFLLSLSHTLEDMLFLIMNLVTVFFMHRFFNCMGISTHILMHKHLLCHFSASNFFPECEWSYVGDYNKYHVHWCTCVPGRDFVLTWVFNFQLLSAFLL